MLKKRILITTITLALSLPSLSSASPLSWTPQWDVLARIHQLWSLFPGAHPATTASGRDQRKNGPGMDPTGTPPPPPPSSQTTPTDPTMTEN